MKKKPVSGEVVAEREYKVRIKPRVFRSVYVRIRKPTPDGQDWYCTYEIEDENFPRAQNIYGVDSLQALIGALMLAKIEVEALKKQYKKDFVLFGSEKLIW